MRSNAAQAPIAVVGMACRLPGARDVHQFWQMLLEGRSAVAPVPPERLDRRLYYNPTRGVAGASYADLAALVDYARDATPDDFLTESDLRQHDLSHITLCRVASEAITDAQLRTSELRERRTGVYVGHATGSGLAGEYSYGVHIPQTVEFLREVKGFNQLTPAVREAVIRDVEEAVRSHTPWRTATHNPTLEASQAAKLIASKFHLDGPQMVFNSACASSLQALAHAMKALSLGRIDAAIVGGASCFHSDTLVLFSQAQSLSTTGSFPFTADADGLIVGEGYIVFVLKTLAAAVAANDRILAVLPNIGVASDGHGKSLWAPRSEGQIEAINRAYPDPRDIGGLQYIEAHATSTSLGDKTEIEAISRVLREHLPAGASIPIGGVKRNVGHTLEVAGAAGLLKVILAMQHGVIPPAVDGRRPLSTEVDWANAPVYVNDKPIAWPRHADTIPVRAAVNAFGIGGLNVHLVVEGYDPAHHRGSASPPRSSPRTPASRVTSEDSRDLAIVGIGAVLPGARDVDHFRALLASGASAVGPFPSETWNPELFDNPGKRGDRNIPLPAAGAVVGFEYDWRKHRIPPKQLAQANPLQFMMLDAVDQAFQQSALRDSEAFDRKRTGCIVGTEFGGDFSTQLLMGLRLPESRETLAEVLGSHGVATSTAAELSEEWSAKVLQRFPALVDESGSFTASALASRITKSFDIMGGGIAVDAGEGGAFAALQCSADMLLTGACDVMVCVAGEHNLLPGTYQIASLSAKLASSADASCPFDPAADGSIPGAGCVALLLMRLEDARSSGLKVHGIIKGIGTARNERRGHAVSQAVQRALSDAGLAVNSIAGIVSVGTGRQLPDEEARGALADAYSSATTSAGSLPLSTPVWQTGNLGSAAGLVSLAAGVMALDNASLPPPKSSIVPKPEIHGLKLRVLSQPQPLQPDAQGQLLLGLDGASSSETSYHVILLRGEPVMQPVRSNFTSPSAWQTEALPNGAVLFDATARRRDKMRTASAAGNGKLAVADSEFLQAATPVAPPRPSLAAPMAPRASAPPSPAALKPPVPAPTVPTPQPPVQPATTALSSDEVESFLVSFVMEQTGYPREIVELDADLEADLGIDSIKKAQLFGEIGEYFDVQASADLSLDAFTTLRSVMQFLLDSNRGEAPSAPVAAEPSKDRQAAPHAPKAPRIVAPTAAPHSPAVASASGGLETQEVETFLVNFVMEQTGYPREIVELDADLEADLGIDSIKKAQLFGELGEYFDVQPSDDLSLDNFSSLRTVMQYLLSNAASAAATDTAPPPLPRSTAAAAMHVPSTSSSTASASLSADEVETFLINFVMEQTGYPREIVELDADLEADLGIDSIKKAQLFGELGEYFDVQPSDNLSLDEFTTLRAVMKYLLSNAGANTSKVDAGEAGGRTDRDEVESFVIEFVMDQTGYPRHVVDLDGDFEIDLGIDSRKQADMLKRLSEHFPQRSLTTQRFSTLRSVVEHIIRQEAAAREHVS